MRNPYETDNRLVFTCSHYCTETSSGRWGFISPDKDGSVESLTGDEPKITEARMHLLPVIAAIKTFKVPMAIVSPYANIYECFKFGLWKKWERHGWKTKAKKPIKDRDLWVQLISAYKDGRVEFLQFRPNSKNGMCSECKDLVGEI